MYSVEKFKNDAGETMARIDLQSDTLPYVSIDTYQSFSGDSWAESEAEWMLEEGATQREVQEVDHIYDFDGIKRGLAEASIEGIINAVDPEFIESIEYLSSWSPQYYNFQTDTYEARYVVNWTHLKKWLKKSGRHRAEWFRERWQSRDGFHSYMYPHYWDEEREAMKVYATIAMYLEETLDEEHPFYTVAEAEYEVYSEHTETLIRQGDYESIMADTIAEVVGQEFDEVALDLLIEARGRTIEELMEEHPLRPVLAAQALMERPAEQEIPGQISMEEV